MVSKTNFEEFVIEKLSGKEFAKSVFELENKLIGGASLDKIISSEKSDNLHYYILKRSGKVVGFFECLIIAPEAELYSIAVDPSHQRKGLGSMLLSHFENLARSKGCETIFLEVNKINRPAISLYKKFGYEIYGERKNYYGNNDAILMKKKI